MSASAFPCPTRACRARTAPEGRRFRLALAVIATLAGCTDFPDLDGRLTGTDTEQGYPALVPAERLLEGTTDLAIQPETQTDLEDRVAALERRADALRATGLDQTTRDRMQAGVPTTQP
jgi:hypothetical protein